MSQLKPMIIVLLMLTSALAGCAGTDTTDLEQQIADLQQSNDEMNETINQQNQDNLELRTLLEGLQLSLDDLDMELQQSNDEMNETINQQRQYLMNEINWINWAHMDLSYANMIGASLIGVDLNGTDLTGADLSGADLRYADLSGADLTYVRAINILGCPAVLPIDWECVEIREHPFDEESEFSLVGSSADLSYADLTGADLTGANLSDADLTGITAAYLQGCPAVLPINWQCVNNNLVGPGVYLRYTDLSGIDLSNANLSNANLYGSILTGANLTGANLTGANLGYANLAYANLTGADLTGVLWYDTTCPDGTIISWASANAGDTCENNL